MIWSLNLRKTWKRFHNQHDVRPVVTNIMKTVPRLLRGILRGIGLFTIPHFTYAVPSPMATVFKATINRFVQIMEFHTPAKTSINKIFTCFTSCTIRYTMSNDPVILNFCFFGWSHKKLETSNLTIIESLVIVENAANTLNEVQGESGVIIKKEIK